MLGNTATTGSKEMLLNIHPLGLIWQRWVNGAYQANLMTLDYDGNFGIGTTSPGTKLEISDGTGPTIRLRRADNSVVAGDLIGGIENYNQDADGAHISSFIRGYATETYGRQGYLTFGTSGVNSTDATEKMRISNVGRVTINQTAVTDAMLTVGGNSSNYALTLYMDVLYASGYRYQRFRSGSNIAGGIEGSNQTSVVYNTSSDYRMKKNIKPLENGLERLSKLKPVKFDWKLNDESTEGFIAHEVQDIFPDAISGEKDGEDMQGMDYGRITPLLVAAIQELKAEIEILKNK